MLVGDGLELEADRSFSRAILGDNNAQGSPRQTIHASTEPINSHHTMQKSETSGGTHTITGVVKQPSQRVREASTVEQALALLLEASSSEAKFRSRVRAAA